MKTSNGRSPFGPRARRWLTVLLATLLVFFCFFGWWTSFAWWREQAWWAIQLVGIAIGGVRTALLFFRGARYPDVPKQEGGMSFGAFALLMMGWWIVSTLLAGTAHGSLTEDRTLTTQASLTGAALTLLLTRRGLALRIETHGARWILSYFVFLGAMFVMLADTDYHRWSAPKTIEWDLWIRWRCLNYGLIVPYLLAGIAVVHGWSLKVICNVGVAAVIALAVLLQLSGVPM